MSITAADAVIVLSASALFTSPVQIQNFSADDIFSTQPIKNKQAQMGVDGILTFGLIYVEKEWDISLMGDSVSNDFMDAIFAYEEANSTVVTFNGQLTLPSLGKTFVMTNGAMTTYPPMPDAGKFLKPRKYGFTWQTITAQPISGV